MNVLDARSLLRSAVLLALGASALGCSTLSEWRLGWGAMMRNKADYDALDEARPTDLAGAEAAAPARFAPHWPAYRGPRADGIYTGGALALDHEAGLPLAWRAEVGPAYSSMVVAGDRVVTIEQRRDREALVALGLDDGRLLWSHSWEERYYDAISKEGPRATPVVSGDAVVALGGEGDVRCVDLATGALLWARDLLPGDEENLEYGLAASPIVLDDLVLVQTPRSLVALELASGEPRWSVLDEPLTYSTPVVAEVLGRRTVIVCAAERVVGIDAASRAEAWSFPWAVSNGLSCTQPIVVAADRVLVSAGYGKGAQLVKLAAPAEAGGAPPEADGEVVWRSSRLKTRFNEPILWNGLVYGLDEGVLVCIDPLTGRRLWKEGRYAYGQLAVADGRLLVVEGSGDLLVLDVDAEGARERHRYDALDGVTNLNLPAFADGRLLLRNERELLCFDLRVRTP